MLKSPRHASIRARAALLHALFALGAPWWPSRLLAQAPASPESPPVILQTDPEAPASDPAPVTPSTDPEAPVAAPQEPIPAEAPIPAPALDQESAPEQPAPHVPSDLPAAEPIAPAPSVPSELAPTSAPTAEAEAPTPSSPAATVDPSAPPIEVTIVGTHLARTPGSAHVVRDKELQRFEYDDVAQVLSSVPGVFSRTEDGMGLRPNIAIRGVNPDRSKKITLMEDGVLFGPAPYSAPAAYYFPIITRMQSVRVIKGPSAVAYGPQTIAGAVDLITRSVPTKPGGALDLAAGEYGYGKGHAYFGASNDQFGFLVEGVRLQNNGYKELMTDPNRDTGFARNEWMAKFSYVVDPSADVRHEFRLKLGYADEVSNETYMGLAPQDFEDNPYARYGATSNDRMTNHHTSVALTHQVDFTPRMSLTTTAYRNDFTRTWRRVDNIPGIRLFDLLASGRREDYLGVLRGQSTFADAIGDPGAKIVNATNGRVFVSEGVQSIFRWDCETGKIAHRFEAGLRLHYDRIERRHTADNTELYGGEPYPDGERTKVTTFNKAATYALAPHLQHAVTFSSLTVTPGLRTELMRMSFVDRAGGKGHEFYKVAVLPGLGLYYALSEELGLLAGAYRGFSAPPPDSGKKGEPEYSINYEAGTRYTKGPLRAEAIGFYNDYSNITGICTASTGAGCSEANQDKQFSAGAARIYGAELLVQHDVPVGKLKLPITLAYTRTQAQFMESFKDAYWGNVEKGDFMPNVPKNLMRASVGVEAEPAGGYVAVSYVGKTGDGSTSDESVKLYTDAQTLVDASAWAKVWGPLRVYVAAQNLLDSVYVVSHRPFGARPNAPRWIHVGLKAAF